MLVVLLNATHHSNWQIIICRAQCLMHAVKVLTTQTLTGNPPEVKAGGMLCSMCKGICKLSTKRKHIPMAAPTRSFFFLLKQHSVSTYKTLGSSAEAEQRVITLAWVHTCRRKKHYTSLLCVTKGTSWHWVWESGLPLGLVL